MAVWVCLLRAVNLGARNKVSMPVLRGVLEQGGFDEVRTYVQSGNVIARSSHRSRERVAALVSKAVGEHFGVDTPVVVRTPQELREVLHWNPFPDAAAQRPKLVQVCHLLATPEPAGVESVLAADVPEQIAVRGEEVVVDYGQSIQGSKVSPAWLARRLGVDSTARNWRTLTALVEMTAD